MDASNDNMINDDFFTSLPRAGDAIRTHQNYRIKLKNSLQTLIKSADSKLNKNLSYLITKIQNLNIDHKFKPALYHLHHKLLESMQNSQASAVIDNLEKIENLTDKEIYSHGLQIKGGIDQDYELFFAAEVEKMGVRNARGELPKFNKEFTSDISHYEKVVRESIALIDKYDRDISDQIHEYVSCITLFEGQSAMGMTDVRSFGAVLIRIPEERHDPIAYFTEHLIHETSHLHLHALMIKDPIVINNPDERYTAPIRPDKSPMFGVFHATFVLSRMTRFFRYLVQNEPTNFNFQKSLKIMEKQFSSGLDVVKQYALCTTLGEKIKFSFENTANSLLKSA